VICSNQVESGDRRGRFTFEDLVLPHRTSVYMPHVQFVDSLRKAFRTPLSDEEDQNAAIDNAFSAIRIVGEAIERARDAGVIQSDATFPLQERGGNELGIVRPEVDVTISGAGRGPVPSGRVVQLPQAVPGCFLLAHPMMSDATFRRAVIFVVESSSSDGSIGFAINSTTLITRLPPLATLGVAASEPARETVAAHFPEGASLETLAASTLGEQVRRYSATVAKAQLAGDMRQLPKIRDSVLSARPVSPKQLGLSKWTIESTGAKVYEVDVELAQWSGALPCEREPPRWVCPIRADVTEALPRLYPPTLRRALDAPCDVESAWQDSRRSVEFEQTHGFGFGSVLPVSMGGGLPNRDQGAPLSSVHVLHGGPMPGFSLLHTYERVDQVHAVTLPRGSTLGEDASLELKCRRIRRLRKFLLSQQNASRGRVRQSDRGMLSLDLFADGKPSLIQRMATHRDPSRRIHDDQVVAFEGTCLWHKGQLEEEMARGDWIAVMSDDPWRVIRGAAGLFTPGDTKPPSHGHALWTDLMVGLGGEFQSLAQAGELVASQPHADSEVARGEEPPEESEPMDLVSMVDKAVVSLPLPNQDEVQWDSDWTDFGTDPNDEEDDEDEYHDDDDDDDDDYDGLLVRGQSMSSPPSVLLSQNLEDVRCESIGQIHHHQIAWQLRATGAPETHAKGMSCIGRELPPVYYSTDLDDSGVPVVATAIPQDVFLSAGLSSIRRAKQEGAVIDAAFSVPPPASWRVTSLPTAEHPHAPSRLEPDSPGSDSSEDTDVTRR
jgi:putative AlgH/UPF0301 family transcriptional regulator